MVYIEVVKFVNSRGDISEMSEYEIGLYRIIGGMLRDIRTSKDLTLEQVASKIGVVPKTLQRYELAERKIRIRTFMELADIMGFDYDGFMAEAKQRLAGKPLMLKEGTPYYAINEETRKIAQEIFEDEDMKLLFNLKKSAQSDDLMSYARYLKERYDRENNL